MRKIRVMLVAAVVLALAYPAGRVFGQAVYGSIIGSVTDSTGAIVPDAKIMITDVNKGVTFETKSNDSGNYEQGHLIVGTYRVRVEKEGFQAYVQDNVQVNVDAATAVNAVLQLGAVTQTVEVTAAVPLLKTERTDVATSFSDRQVEDLPIYNRNFTTFQLLSPGNQRLNGWNHAASENPQGSQQILTQGQHFAGTAFELDGTDNQDPILGIIVINPNLEAVTEVKITAQDYDAEFGKAIGAVVTSQTKSGSNDLHGSIFDFERSNSNLARDPFTQATINVPSGNWNQFGGSLGGPIKKNKVFIFGDYQGTRRRLGGSQQDRIPTAAERAGDLSDLGVNIYDPYETTDATHSTLVLDANGNPIPLAAKDRTQFPGNMIPGPRLSMQAQNLLALYPVGASGTGLNSNFFGSGSQKFDDDGFDVRPDAYVSEKLHVFGRYSYQNFTRGGPGLFGNVLGGPALVVDPSLGQFAGTSKVRNQSVAGGFDYTLRPTWLTDFRFGYFRYQVNVLPGGFGTTPAADAGIKGLNVDKVYTTGMPFFDVSVAPGAPNFQFGYALGPNQCNCPLTESEHQFQFVNNWTNIRGNHTIKFGADIRHAYNLRVPSDAHRAGQIHFNNDISQGPGGVGGAGLAGFLLGDVSSFERYVSVSTNASETQPRLFFYGQDTYRMTPKLTLNFGLRWEIYAPESVNQAGNGGWVDLATGEMRVAGGNGVDLRGNTNTSFTHLSPRAGLAYQLNPKTVVRAGYGRSYDIGVFGSIFGHTVTQNLPVLAQQSISGGGAGSQDFNTAFFLSTGPPAFDTTTALTQNNCNAITDPTGATVVNATTNTFVADKTSCVGSNGRPMLRDGVFSRSRPFNNRLPTVDAWNFSVQRQVTSTIAATISYVGNKGTHTLIGDNPAYGVNNATVAGYNPNTPGISGPVLPSNCTNSSMLPHNCRVPYYLKYGWSQGIDYFGEDANNKYNALQAVVEKRFAAGFSFQANYTFQHAIYNANDGYFNIAHISYGPNSNYRNHVLIFTEVYELPFGRGKKFAGNVSRLADLAIGGWKLNTTTNFSSGLPFNYGLSTCGPSIDNGPCRADKVGTIKDGTRSGPPQSVGYWFQPTPIDPSTGKPTVLNQAGQTAGSWGQPALDTFGNTGWNPGRGPKFFNTDLSLFKDFKATEKVTAQFQFQAYNVFNHVNLGNPAFAGSWCVDCGNAGSINNTAFGQQMRALQFGLKITY